MAILRRIAVLLRRGRFDREIDEELRFHLEMTREAMTAAGATDDAAAWHARRRLGSALAIRERARAPWTIRFVDELMQDVRYAVRVIVRRPALNACTMAVLALGIGASTSMFSFVYGVLLRPLPFDDPGRLVVVRPVSHAGGRVNPGVSWSSPAYLALSAGARALDGLAAFTGTSANLVIDGQPSHAWSTDVSPNFFAVLGVEAARGRVFDPRPSPPVFTEVVISDRLWRERFGSRADIIGRSLLVNGEPRTVVGVLAPGFVFRTAHFEQTAPSDVWSPMRFDPNRHGSWFLQLVGRLRDGVTPAQGEADLARITAGEIARYPHGRDLTATVVALEADVSRDVRRILAIFAGGVALLLLVAGTNAGALFLIRAIGRDRELALRLAIGAGRGRVVRQLVTESLIVAFVAGAAGVGLALGLTTLLVRLAPAGRIPRLESVLLDRPVLLFALALTLLVGVLCGAGPAWHCTRSAARRSLASGAPGRATAGPAAERWRTSLVALQVTSTVVLLVGALLLGRSLVRLAATDDGFTSGDVVTATMQLPESRQQPEVVELWRRLLEDLRQRPGLQGTSAINQMPLNEFFFVTGDYTVAGRSVPEPPNAAKPKVAPGYFRALGIPLRRGRDFTTADVAGAPPVAIVSERFARLYFGAADPTGARVSLDSPGAAPWFTIVGVVGDIRQGGPGDTPVPAVYVPYAQSERGFFVQTLSLVVPTALDPAVVSRSVHDALRRVDPTLPVLQVARLDDLRGRALAQPRFRGFVLGVFALTALALATAGLFASVSHSVAQRWTELGVRMALGAGRPQIARLVLSRALTPVAIGLAAGLVLAAWLATALTPFLYETPPRDLMTLLVAATSLAVAGLLASAWPAWRATRVDPTIALRAE